MGLHRGLTVDARSTVALASARRELGHLALDHDDVAGQDLTAKSRVLDPAEERQTSGVLRFGEDHHGTALRDRFEQQHARRRWSTGEVTSKEPFVTLQSPEGTGA